MCRVLILNPKKIKLDTNWVFVSPRVSTFLRPSPNKCHYIDFKKNYLVFLLVVDV